MFSSRGLFDHIQCPHASSCRLPNCIFNHDRPKQDGKEPSRQPNAQSALNGPAHLSPSDTPTHTSSDDLGKERTRTGPDLPKKRGREDVESSSGIKSDFKITKLGGNHLNGKISTGNEAARQSPSGRITPKSRTATPTNGGPAAKPSAPHNKHAPQASPRTISHEKKESLNPRVLQKPPAEHAIRRTLLIKIHEAIVKLNAELIKSNDGENRALTLSENEAIKLALDEESKIAMDQPAVYSNLVKHRIVALKKMKLPEWIAERRSAKGGSIKSSEVEQDASIVKTGLESAEEVKMLPRLVADQTRLDRFGYVTTPPSEADIEIARRGVDAAAGFETCDRCGSRFQVYPDRREDGALTSGGSCQYHWGKLQYPPREKTDTVKGPKDPTFTCCGQTPGSEPCTSAESHVFKVSEAKRLAMVMPFIKTPFNEEARTDRAVCFDCEMGYTVNGLELIRLTAVSWPSGEPLLDFLVRPLGAVLDLGTRFSGVTPEHFSNAPQFDGDISSLKGSPDLCIVPDPMTARDLLLSQISCDTPLLGHALENDLNAVRLVHPAIVDTVLLFPHPKGLPLRFGLRMLTKRYLKRDIQTAGAAGHDSLEDARATGDLIRFQIGKKWAQMKEQGWTVEDGVFTAPQDAIPPSPPGAPRGTLSSILQQKRRAEDDELPESPEKKRAAIETSTGVG